MGKKRRNTAKTGDKKLYQSRGQDNDSNNNNSDDDDDGDPMYNRVDRFHNQKEENFLKLDAENDSDSDDGDGGLEPKEEAVMDLALGGGDDDSDSDDDDRSSDDSSVEKKTIQKKGGPEDDGEDESEEENSVSSSDDEDDNEDMDENVRDWGRRKSAYYHGDTADLEIGQDEEDAVLEEQAAKEVQKARYEEMSEEDFILSDAEDVAAIDAVKDGADGGTAATLAGASRNVSKLSTKDKQKLLDRQHPELLPLLSHFSNMAEDLSRNTSVAAKAIFEGEEGTAESIGATKLGQQYLKTKALLQSSATLNLAMYMLLKAEQASDGSAGSADAALIQSHPVMLHLQKINSLSQTLEDMVEHKVPGLKEQLGNLVKAAALLNNSGDVSDSDSSDEDEEDPDDTKIEATKEPAARPTLKVSPVDDNSKIGSKSSGDSEDSDESSDDEAARSRKVLTEARFGLRQNEFTATSQPPNRRRKAPPIYFDAGDDDDDTGDRKTVSQSLATTLNSIEQRTASRKRRAAPLADAIDEPEEEDGELRRGLEMMEAELGKGSDEDDEDMGSGFDPERDSDEEEDGKDFYSQVAKKSKSKKEFKKKLYQVAPKFPRVEGVVEGERAISKQILTNRGLVAHKPKINRNPRVKKREQYRKALIRRKGAVREVRTDEGHRYGGEETGIKTNLSRSRKLAR